MGFSRKIKKNRIVSFFAIFAILIALFVMIIIFAWRRGKQIVSNTYSVPCRSSCSIRIAALADLHGEVSEDDEAIIIQSVRAADPDLITFLGDMIDKSHTEDSAKAVISLTKQLIKIAPVIYVDGNHEKDVQKENPEFYLQLNHDLSEAGAVQLENETVHYVITENENGSIELNPIQPSEIDNIRGNLVNLCGITTHYYWGECESTLVDDLSKLNGINILLCHYPESVIWYNAFGGGGLDAALCGHTHGGLIRFPIAGGLYAPEQSWWPLYDLGPYPIYTDTNWDNYGGEEYSDYLGTMIISGGLAGEHGVPRMNNPRDISIIDFETVNQGNQAAQ